MSKKQKVVVEQEAIVSENSEVTSSIASPVLGDVAFDPITSGQSDAVKNS